MGQDLSVKVECLDRGLADRVVAEAYAAGAAGIVEEPGDRVMLTIYLDSDRQEGLASCLRALAPEGLSVQGFERIPTQAWGEVWKLDHGPIEISSRLRVRPPFVAASARTGQIEVTIEPGQAFGTGQHESTRLALESVDDRLGVRAVPTEHVLDVGTGSGILSLAALGLGAQRAVGHDIDAVAVFEAARHARAHAWGERFDLFSGSIEALRPTAFDLVIVNMLRSEMIPIASEIGARVGDELILSGLLESDVDATLNRFVEEGLVHRASREATDASGNTWVGLRLNRS